MGLKRGESGRLSNLNDSMTPYAAPRVRDFVQR